MKIKLLSLCCLFLFLLCIHTSAKETSLDGSVRREAANEKENRAYAPENLLDEYIDLDAIQAQLFQAGGTESFSFKTTVRKLIAGDIPFDPQKLLSYISDLFFREVKHQKNMVVQVFIIVLVSAIFSNFIKVFENSQIAQISFYMIYFLICAMLLHSFTQMDVLGKNTCNAINNFMKVLLPIWLRSFCAREAYRHSVFMRLPFWE